MKQCEWCPASANCEIVATNYKGEKDYVRYSCPEHLRKTLRLAQLDGYDKVEWSVMPAELRGKG